jgi:hypothetical protein
MGWPPRARHAHCGALAYGSVASGAWRGLTSRTISM